MASEISMSWTPVPENRDRAGPIIEVTFSGLYPPGSAGNDAAASMASFLQRALEDADASGVIIDLTGLDYTFGDAIGNLAIPLADSRHRIRPAAVIARERTHAALKPLFGPNYVFGVVGVQLVQRRIDALEHVTRAVNNPQRPGSAPHPARDRSEHSELSSGPDSGPRVLHQLQLLFVAAAYWGSGAVAYLVAAIGLPFAILHSRSFAGAAVSTVICLLLGYAGVALLANFLETVTSLRGQRRTRTYAIALRIGLVAVAVTISLYVARTA